jgi:hypothetical protein
MPRAVQAVTPVPVLRAVPAAPARLKASAALAALAVLPVAQAPVALDSVVQVLRVAVRMLVTAALVVQVPARLRRA